MTSDSASQYASVPLDWITPTSAEQLRLCPMRLAFNRSPLTTDWVRGSTRSALGTVAHRLTELVYSGQAPTAGRRAWLERRWTELLEEEHRLLAEQWIDSVVPSPAEWPGVTATRVRLLRRLETVDVDQHRQPSQGHLFGHAGKRPRPRTVPPALPWVERMLHDEDRGIRGRPDRVEVHHGQPRVVDLKSGVHALEMTPPRERQLLTYAHLVEVELGVLPRTCVVTDPRGREVELAVDASTVRQVVHELTSMREEFNRSLRGLGPEARPAADVCSGCPFRVECEPYWVARESTWPSLDVRGVVSTLYSDGSIELELSGVERPVSHFRIVWHGELRPSIGEVVTVIDLQKAGPDTGRMHWWSRWRSHGLMDRE